MQFARIRQIFMVMEGSSRNFSISTKKQVNMTDKDNLIRQRLSLRFKTFRYHIKHSILIQKLQDLNRQMDQIPLSQERSFPPSAQGLRDEIHFTCLFSKIC